MNHLAAKEEQSSENQQGRQRGDQGTTQSLVQRQVDHLFGIALTQLTKVFTNPVRDHDGIVKRVAYNRQNCRQHRQIKI